MPSKPPSLRQPWQKPKAQADHQQRSTARQRGYGSKWDKARREFLALPENRLCFCGCGKVADTVDHKVPHKGDQKLFWDRKNWQPMHRACHSRKTAGEDGGFGRKPQVKGCDVMGRPLDPDHPWNRNKAT